MKMYRNIVERSCMSNNNEIITYTPHKLSYDSFKTYKLVISRPVYDYEIEEGLKIINNKEISTFNEKVPDITQFLDGLYRLKIRFEWDKKMFHEYTLEKSINHYVSYNYYDCMSGGCNGYILSMFRYIIENTEDFNLDEKLYPGKNDFDENGKPCSQKEKEALNEKDSWYDYHDFLKSIEKIERFEDITKKFKNKLPDIKQFLLEEIK